MGASQSKKVTAQGKYRSPQTSSLMADRAILDLKIQRDKLHQYQKRIQTVLNREKQVAKEALAQGNKSKALLILRRRKYQEQVLVKADQQLETLEQLVHAPHVLTFLTFRHNRLNLRWWRKMLCLDFNRAMPF
jgi:2-oxoglutarate dehydrogenase complex dehydrogenase (E1) component-like enzyme